MRPEAFVERTSNHAGIGSAVAERGPLAGESGIWTLAALTDQRWHCAIVELHAPQEAS